MANRYVYSGAAGAGTGADWANAFTTMTAAAAADAAGDVFYVAHDHAESTAGSVTLNIAGSEATPSFIYCVNRAGSVPPVSADLRTTGTVTTTTTSTITLNGAFYCYGLTFTAADGANSGSHQFSGTNGHHQVYQNCVFTKGGTGASTTFSMGLNNVNHLLQFVGCTFNFSAVSQTMTINRPTVLRNCTIGGSAIPTNVISMAIQGTKVLLEGCNLSAIGSGKNIFSSLSLNSSVCVVKDCRLGASVTPSPEPVFGANIDFINCDSADTNYRIARYYGSGTMTTETTIVRTGGASNGTTPYSWKIVTNGTAEPVWPFECPPIVVWNETVGSAVTVTVEGTWSGGAVPTNANIWLEVQSLNTSGFPIASLTTNGKTTPLHTATNQAASSAVWGGGTTDFSMSATFTPQEKGPIYVYVKAGLASTTFYVDPKVTLS